MGTVLTPIESEIETRKFGEVIVLAEQRTKDSESPVITPLLRVEDLCVHFPSKARGDLVAVDHVNFSLYPGEVLGLVGESGGGKTILSLSLLRLLPSAARIVAGTVVWNGMDLLALDKNEMRQVRGKQIAMIFQNPQASLNPVYSIETQLTAILRLHRALSTRDARDEAIRMLRLVKIADPEKRMSEYPHQMSAGMCQRVVIAMALACEPGLLIADEPTASLDVTIQAQILNLLLELREELGMAILLVSHDLGVIARMCDRIAVMYLGRIVELAPAMKLYRSPKHPYTQALLASIPVPDPSMRSQCIPLRGDLPSPFDIPSGCRFRSRCPEAFDLCLVRDPHLECAEGDDHLTACLMYGTEEL